MKLSLNPSPTFKASVEIPVPGGAPASVEFTFRHRGRPDVKSFVESLGDKSDCEVVLACASGWDLSDPFDAENVQRLLDNYFVSGERILATYLRELTAGRLGN